MKAVVLKLTAQCPPGCDHLCPRAAHPTAIFAVASQPMGIVCSIMGADRLGGNLVALPSLLVVHVARSNSRTRHLRHDGVGYQFSKLLHEFLVEHLGSF